MPPHAGATQVRRRSSTRLARRAAEAARTPPRAAEAVRTPPRAAEAARTPPRAAEAARTPPRAAEAARTPPRAAEAARTPPRAAEAAHTPARTASPWRREPWAGMAPRRGRMAPQRGLGPRRGLGPSRAGPSRAGPSRTGTETRTGTGARTGTRTETRTRTPQARRAERMASAEQFLGEERGPDLVGREILICWTDGSWYDALVVRFYPRANEYKLVYRADDGVEVISLHGRRWLVSPKVPADTRPTVMDGAIVEFVYPVDGRRYKGMIYDYSHDGNRVEIAYLDEHSTDTIRGGNWDLISPSPCVEDQSSEEDAELLYEQTMATLRRDLAQLEDGGETSESGSERSDSDAEESTGESDRD